MATQSNDSGSNTSVFNRDEILRRYNDNEANALLPVIIYVSFLMVSGLFGNSLVIYIYKFRFRRSSSRTFILCLAILDTTACAFGMPFHIADMLYPYIFYSAAACKSLSYIMSIVILASTFVLVLIASDRYQKICKTFQRQISDYGTKKACIFLIILAAIFASPHLILYGERSVVLDVYNITGTECYVSDYYVETSLPMIYNGILLLIFISSTITLATLYSLVGLKVWRRGAFLSDSKNKTGKDGNSTWKFCGNISDTREEVFSDSGSGKADVKSVSYQKTPQGDKTRIEYETATTPIYRKPNSDNRVSNTVNEGVSDSVDEPKEKDKLTALDSPNDSNPNATKHSKLAKKSKKDKKRKRFFSSESDSENRAETGSSFTRSKYGGSANSRASYTPKRQKRAIRITIMLFTITVVYVISFLPFLVITVMDTLHEEFWTGISPTKNVILNLFLRTYFINNMVNPIIYGFLDAKFRSEASDLFRRLCGCFTNDD